MNNVLIATLGGVTALVGWGVSDWLAARSSKRYDNIEVNFAIQIPGFLIMLAILLLSHQQIPSLSTIAVIASVSVFFTSAYVLFIKALSTGSVGIVVPVANTYPVFTLLLTVTLLSTHFSAAQIISMLIIVAGAMVLAYEKWDKQVSLRVLYKETFLALGTALAWGIGFFIANTQVQKVSWQVLLGIMSLAMGVLASMLLVYSHRGKVFTEIAKIRHNGPGLWSGLMLTAGSIALYYAAERSGGILIPAVIGSAAPLIAALLGAVIDKEKLGVAKRVGAIIVVAGLVLLNIT